MLSCFYQIIEKTQVDVTLTDHDKSNRKRDYKNMLFRVFYIIKYFNKLIFITL